MYVIFGDCPLLDKNIVLNFLILYGKLPFFTFKAKQTSMYIWFIMLL